MTPEGQIYDQNSKFWQFWGCIPTFLPQYLAQGPVRNFTFIGATCVAPAGEKPIFGLLSKNNTGMAALRAGLPVTKKKKHHTFSPIAGARPTIPTILCVVIEKVRPIIAPLNFFLIRSVVSLLGAIENLWENSPTAGNAYNLSVCPSKVTKQKT